MTPVELVLARLEAAGSVPRRSGSSWQAKCPAHPDRDPSLSVSEGADLQALINCHAGCTSDAVLSTLGLTYSDLFPPKSSNGQGLKIQDRYRYTDEEDHLLFEVVRLDPKSFRQRRPNETGGWTWKLGDTRRVLYRLSAVMDAVRTGATIFIVEGERDVHALEARGEVATTNPGGAGKWRQEHTDALIGAAEVVIVADRDEPGYRHAQAIRSSLVEASIPAVLAEPLEGKDVSDHLAAGHGVNDLMVLGAAAGTSPPPEPPQDVEPPQQTLSERFESRLLGFDAMGQRPLPKYVVKGILVESSLTGLYGPPGTGKSFIALDLGAHVAVGAWWRGREVTPGRVLYIAAEGIGGLPKRVEAWKNHNHIHAVPNFDFYPGAVNLLDAEQVAAAAAVVKARQYYFIIVDTVARSIVGGDENNAKDMGQMIANLDWLKNASGALVMVVHHTGKDTSAGMRGSSSLEGALDSVLEVKGGGGSMQLSCKKQKDDGEFTPVSLSLEVVTVRMPTGEDATSCAVTERSLDTWVPEVRIEEAKGHLVQLMSSTGMSGADVLQALQDRLSVQRTASFALRNALVAEGFLRTRGEGRLAFYEINNGMEDR